MIVFALMDTVFVDTRRRWCMLSSELGSVRSLRRFPSVGTEFAAVVLRASVAQQYPYIGSCIDVRRTCTRSFSVVSFTQLKKSVYKILCSPLLLLFITSLVPRPHPPSSASLNEEGGCGLGTRLIHYWLITSARAASCCVTVAASMNKV